MCGNISKILEESNDYTIFLSVKLFLRLPFVHRVIGHPPKVPSPCGLRVLANGTNRQTLVHCNLRTEMADSVEIHMTYRHKIWQGSIRYVCVGLFLPIFVCFCQFLSVLSDSVCFWVSVSFCSNNFISSSFTWVGHNQVSWSSAKF